MMFARERVKFLFGAIAMVFCLLSQARADAVLLLEEPYGRFGSFNPTGHAAVFLTNVCADSPTHLRPCEPGESGVVISRYDRIAGYDWIAVPLIPYLYAVERAEQIPAKVNASAVAELRDRYRRAHLLELAPDAPDGRTPAGNWYELIGSAYDRGLFGFQVETRPEQDAALIAWLNGRRNHTRFELLWANCADFAASVLNFYYPHAIHRNFFSDVGIMTPKQVARSLVRYSRRHSILEPSVFRIPQVAGSIGRSRSVDGLAEMVLKSKKYVVPLAVISPVVAGSIAAVYFAEGRFNPRHNVASFDLLRLAQPVPAASLKLKYGASDISSRSR